MKAKPAIAIVTAGDAGYFDMLSDLVLSIRDKPQGRDIPIAVLDVGLGEEHIAWLSERVESIVAPGWDMDYPERDKSPNHFKAMTARPFLPKHFPQYDGYIWIDADAWLQTWEAIDIYLEALTDHGFAIVPELDRSYACVYNRNNARKLVHDVLLRGFSRELAESLVWLPVLNSGGFCMWRESPIWQAWQRCMEDALRRYYHHMVEQTALNVVLYSQRGLPCFLPAYCNWICIHALPAYSEQEALLVEPCPPHRPLSVIHLAGKVKNHEQIELRTTKGGTKHLPLGYQALRKLEAIQVAR